MPMPAARRTCVYARMLHAAKWCHCPCTNNFTTCRHEHRWHPNPRTHTRSSLVILPRSFFPPKHAPNSGGCASPPRHMQAEDTRGQAFPLLALSACDLCHCYVYANSLWHNSFETVENWIVPLGQTFRPPPWLYSSATVNWVQRWLHTLYFRERLQLGNNFCTGKTNANSWQKHWSCLVVQPPIWRNTDCSENFFGHLRSK